jgi:hypothetical protein
VTNNREEIFCNQVTKNTRIEDSEGNIKIQQRKIPKIWGNFTTDFQDRAKRPEREEVENEYEVDPVEYIPSICQSEVEKATKEMKVRKTTRNDDVFKVSREDYLKMKTKIIQNINETKEWLKDFINVKLVALNGKPEATKCSDHRTISLVEYTAKIATRILRRTEKKLRMSSKEISLDLEEKKKLQMQLEF